MPSPRLQTVILLSIIVLCSCLYEKPQKEIVSNGQFGIELTLPYTLMIIPTIEKERFNEQGNRALSEVVQDKRIDTWTTILQAKRGFQNNYLAIASSYYDSELHGDDYEKQKSNRFQGNRLILERKGGVTIDEKRYFDDIDGVEFDCQEIKIEATENKKLLGFMKTFEKRYANNDLLIISITAKNESNYKFLNQVLDSIKLNRKL